MKNAKFLGLVLALMVVVALTIYAGSQAKGESKTVTGCLQKGDEPNEYSITDAGGKTYEMRSSQVKLAENMGNRGITRPMC